MIVVEKIAIESEIKEILKVREIVFTFGMHIQHSLDVDGNDKISDEYHLFKAMYDGKIVGTIRAKLEGDTIRLQRFAVLNDYRNLGIGIEIFRYVMSYYKNLGFKHIYFDAMLYVKELYERLGFKAIGEPFMEAGYPHVKMVIDL